MSRCLRVCVIISSPNLRIVFAIARSGFDRHRRTSDVCIFVSTVRDLSWTIVVIGGNRISVISRLVVDIVSIAAFRAVF